MAGSWPRRGGLLVLLFSLSVTGISCGDAMETVSRCIPEGSCDNMERRRVTRTFSSVEGDAEQGGKLFGQLCATCHGAEGDGLGKPSRGDFRDPAWHQRHTDNEIRHIIQLGRGMAMPAIPLKDAELQHVIAFVRTLKRAKAPAGQAYP